MLEFNRIYNEDCLGERGMCLIPDKSVDMILCDLPYGVSACAWDIIIPFEPLWKQYERIIKDNGAIVLTATQPFATDLINSKRDLFRYEWIWEKERPTNVFSIRNQPGKVHENVLVFYKNSPVYNPQFEPSKRSDLNDKHRHKSQSGTMSPMKHVGATKMMISDDYDPTRRYPRSVIKISRGIRPHKRMHPTQKPVALFEYLIRTYTNEHDVVLDNCIGSGTTAVACLNTGRNFIGFEKDPEYHRIANERIANVQSALFV